MVTGSIKSVIYPWHNISIYIIITFMYIFYSNLIHDCTEVDEKAIYIMFKSDWSIRIFYQI